MTTDKFNSVNRTGVCQPQCPHLQGFVATGITQPVDVLKTRLMNARTGEYKVGVVHTAVVLYHLCELQTHTHTHSSPLLLPSWPQRLFYIACTTQLHLAHWHSSRWACTTTPHTHCSPPHTHCSPQHTPPPTALCTPNHPPLAGLPACLHPPGTAHHTDFHSSRTVEITFPAHIAV